MNQEIVFQKSEGDNWFQRNAEALLRLKKEFKLDWPLRLIKKAGLNPRNVLEIGASNGWRLAAIHDLYHARCTALDPSRKALADGRVRYPNIMFKRGVASALPFKDNEFNLIIISFVFHWIDRSRLLRSISEADRVLKQGGYLLVMDFLPDKPEKVPYHHLSLGKVFTYKCDYAGLFTASGLYQHISRVIFDHSDRKEKRVIPPSEKAACTLLRKDL